MNAVDVVAILAAIGYGFTGYRNGAVAGALSIGGFLLGAVLGGRLAGPISTRVAHGNGQVPVAIIVVVFSALVVQAAGVWLALRLRSQITWRPARALDSGLGAVLSAVGVLVVVWMLALPLASSPFVGLAREIRESRVVHGVDDAMPGPVRSAYSSLRDLADRDGFPQVFGDLQASHIRTVAPPDSALARSAVVTRARASIVKVVAGSDKCGHGSEGSGFVYAPGRVITNAHVVAGMNRVSVLDDGTRSARVVLFDPDIDLAVLQVSGLRPAPGLRQGRGHPGPVGHRRRVPGGRAVRPGAGSDPGHGPRVRQEHLRQRRIRAQRRAHDLRASGAGPARKLRWALAVH